MQPCCYQHRLFVEFGLAVCYAQHWHAYSPQTLTQIVDLYLIRMIFFQLFDEPFELRVGVGYPICKPDLLPWVSERPIEL